MKVVKPKPGLGKTKQAPNLPHDSDNIKPTGDLVINDVWADIDFERTEWAKCDRMGNMLVQTVVRREYFVQNLNDSVPCIVSFPSRNIPI